MAGERIKLFEADIDVDGVIKKSVELQDDIVQLSGDLKELKLTVGKNSEEYVKAEAALKKTRKEYNQNQKQVANLTGSYGKMLTVQQKIDAALGKEIRSINSAVKNNKELREIRNDINAETEEGAKAIAELNKKIDENTEFIRENTDAYSQQKMAIGDYKNQIQEALGDLNMFNGGLLGFIMRAQEAGGVTNLVSNSVSSATTAIKGMTKASLAFIATPIGAILAVIAGAVALVANAMNRSEESTNKLNKVFSVFSGVLNYLLKALEPIGEFLIDGIVAGFELAQQAAEDAITIISGGLKLLGFDSAAKSVLEFGEGIKEATQQAMELAEAEAQLEKNQRKARLTQLQYQEEAEKFRQIRDNESLSIRERMAANEQLGQVLKNQLNTELELAQAALKVANLRIQQEGETKEALDAQYEALTEIQDIRERITSQESEQLTNRNSLIREAQAAADAAFQKEIKRQETELKIFIENQGVRAKTLKEQLELAEEISEREIAIEKQKLEKKKISQEEYDLFLKQKQNELAEQRAKIAEENLDREIEDFREAYERKLEEGAYFSEESLNQETERLNNLLDAEKQYWADKLEAGIVNQNEYNDAIEDLEKEHQESIKEIKDERAEAEKEKRAIDLANEREARLENLEYDLEFQLQELEAKRQQEIEAAEKTGADIALINEKYAKIRTEIEETVKNNKLSLASETASNFVSILGKESALGKAAAITQTTIDTYQAATAAYKAMAGIPIVGPALGAVAAGAAVVSGLANVKKIASTKLPKAEKGMSIDIGGKRHSAGGTKFYGEDGTQFEAEAGEKMFILNRQASASLAPLLSDINQQYGGVSLSRSSTYLASGGQVLRSIPQNETVDYDKMSRSVSDAVREGSMAGSREGSMQGSSMGTYSGIVDRDTNEAIAAGANF